MAVRMVALVRSPNGEFVARKGIPADVREAYPANSDALMHRPIVTIVSGGRRLGASLKVRRHDVPSGRLHFRLLSDNETGHSAKRQ
jgi:hypothetical protein